MICTWYDPFVSRQSSPDFGRQIRRARAATGLSQVQLAERLGRSERTVQTWEANERNPRLDNLIALADCLGQPLPFFYGDEEIRDEVAA